MILRIHLLNVTNRSAVVKRKFHCINTRIPNTRTKKHWKHKCDECELTFKNLASLASHKTKDHQQDKQKENVSKSYEEKHPNESHFFL